MTNEIDLTFYEKLTPTAYIEYMFDNTDENDILVIPDFPHAVDESIGEYSLRCHMDWSYSDCEKILKNFVSLDKSLKKIAKYYDVVKENAANAKRIFGDSNLYTVWHTYIRDYNLSDFDTEQMSDIIDRNEQIYDVQKIAKQLSKGNQVDEWEKEFLANNINVNITENEGKLYDTYWNTILKECKERVGKNLFAYQLVLRAQRLYRLYSLDAPEIITDNEGRYLAQALVLHNYCRSIETTDYSALLHQQMLSEMSDEQLDEYYKPKKGNSRKSLAPLFVYLILKEKSSAEKPLRQKDILEILSGFPYEIKIERKALSRIIHGLCDSQLSIYSNATGIWMAK